MAVDFYCTRGCRSADACLNNYDGPCAYSYIDSQVEPEFRWKGEGNPPARWKTLDGTIVYRSFADYCDD